MKIRHLKIALQLIALSCIAVACSKSKGSTNKQSPNSEANLSEDSLLTLVQKQTFQYFWDGAEPVSGMARERFHMDNIYPHHSKDIITSGGSGFGLMAIVVGIERGFITRKQGIDRFKQVINYLEKADTFHGVWPHWWNGPTGKVYPFSKKDDGGDLVETSFLAAGLLTVRQYLNPDDTTEKELIDKINTLWEGIEFNWHTKGGEDILY